MGLAYIDGFLCVGGNLTVGALIADSNWSGGVFVGGDLRGHTLVIKDIGVEVDGTQHVEKVADCDDPDAAIHAMPALFIDGNPDPRALFLALRTGLGDPRFVEREFEKFLACGLRCHGFVRVRCDGCADERLVAFSCKTRGVCPSCTSRRMAGAAAHLVERVLPAVPRTTRHSGPAGLVRPARGQSVGWRTGWLDAHTCKQ